MKPKPRYIATYFVYVNSSCEQRQSSFRGTKREIINRLKRLNPHSYTDGLQIHDDEGNLLWGEEGVLFIGEFFTDDEWFEISGQEKEVDDCTLNLDKLFTEADSSLPSDNQEEQHSEQAPYVPAEGEDLGIDPDQPPCTDIDIVQLLSLYDYPLKVPLHLNLLGFYYISGRPMLPFLVNRLLSSRDPPTAHICPF